MKKSMILKYIKDMEQVIKENPELFSDGIEYDILDLLEVIKKYLQDN